MATQPRPAAVTPHGRVLRGLESVPRSLSYEGRFGRLFRNLPPFEPDDQDLIDLAASMIENDVDLDEDETVPSDNARVPAGFTYLGQFIDHDLTFDPTSKLQRDNDPDGLRNFRTPRFDLDSLYGRGPDDSPFQYEADGIRFLIDTRGGEKDLPRNSIGVALIGDPRNDENLIVSQLHLAFLKYHNQVVAELARNPGGGSLFEDARTLVRWHYQWVVLHDFLERIVGQEVIDDILKAEPYRVIGRNAGPSYRLKADLKFFDWKQQPFMPVEFSGAAYRFGHSMVRRDYALNAATAAEGQEVVIFDPAHPNDPNANDLRGFRPRPPNRQIEWFRFFRFPGKEKEVQPARAIDTLLVFPLGGLPTSVARNPSSLPARNLLRGKALGLPSGQAVACAMGISERLIVRSDNTEHRLQVGSGYKLPNGKPDPSVPPVSPKKAHLEQVFGQETPLWYYILKEAELIGKGETLGPVGGRIVAEVFIGILMGDSLSFLNVAPHWRPKAGQFGCPADGKFTMADLLRHVQEVTAGKLQRTAVNLGDLAGSERVETV
jgi:hypothetical protein